VTSISFLAELTSAKCIWWSCVVTEMILDQAYEISTIYGLTPLDILKAKIDTFHLEMSHEASNNAHTLVTR
jgi:hypothetical protein